MNDTHCDEAPRRSHPPSPFLERPQTSKILWQHFSQHKGLELKESFKTIIKPMSFQNFQNSTSATFSDVDIFERERWCLNPVCSEPANAKTTTLNPKPNKGQSMSGVIDGFTIVKPSMLIEFRDPLREIGGTMGGQSSWQNVLGRILRVMAIGTDKNRTYHWGRLTPLGTRPGEFISVWSQFESYCLCIRT